ncbi:hypothetical protein B0H16DRAFT_1474968 [Mycena metata]|uniref:Uncharacterized protein n=1 Tax=Mycena metata TaxID=1033252 RepID=A0AAD7MIQ7_9AGAR|nr:hypothetical protein B0H16DRAFT_1474968 [Mycena metata]
MDSPVQSDKESEPIVASSWKRRAQHLEFSDDEDTVSPPPLKRIYTRKHFADSHPTNSETDEAPVDPADVFSGETLYANDDAAIDDEETGDEKEDDLGGFIVPDDDEDDTESENDIGGSNDAYDDEDEEYEATAVTTDEEE